MKKKRKKKVVTVFPEPENLEAVKLRGLWVKINSVGGGARYNRHLCIALHAAFDLCEKC